MQEYDKCHKHCGTPSVVGLPTKNLLLRRQELKSIRGKSDDHNLKRPKCREGKRSQEKEKRSREKKLKFNFIFFCVLIFESCVQFIFNTF